MKQKVFVDREEYKISKIVGNHIFVKTVDGEKEVFERFIGWHSVGLGASMPKDTRDEVVKELILGLITDGAHHKQYYLESAFRALCEEEYVEKTKKEFQWEDGIPS